MPLFCYFKEKDVDFQSDVHCIWGHWKGFTDPHSDIAYYRVGLGTTSLTDDVEPLINVGLCRGILHFMTNIIFNMSRDM